MPLRTASAHTQGSMFSAFLRRNGCELICGIEAMGARPRLALKL